VLAGTDDDGSVDGGVDEGGGSDEGGVDEGGGSVDGGGDDGGGSVDGGGDEGGSDEGGAEDDGGLDEGGEDLVGWPDPDPDPEPPGCVGAELAVAEPGGVALIGVGASDVLNLEPGGLRNALGDRDALGDALEPTGKAAPRAGAVAGLPADACGWS
jgi:hypothetical protein